jgi:hypothetical protein
VSAKTPTDSRTGRQGDSSSAARESEARKNLRRFAILALFGSFLGCDDQQTNDQPLWPPLVVHRVEPPTLLPTTWLRIDATGLVDDPLATYEVTLEGTLGDTPLTFTLPAAVRGPRTLGATLSGELHRSPGTRFVGVATITRHGPDGTTTAQLPVELTRAINLTPTLAAFPHPNAHLGDSLLAEGTSLLLPNEGFTLARFDGELTLDTTGLRRTITALTVPGFTAGQWTPSFVAAAFWDPSTRLDRKHLGLALSPDIFGILPGRFEGTLRLVNAHADGTDIASEPLPITLTLSRPTITALSPSTASRGQYLTFVGRGFATSDGLFQSATIIALEGIFTPRRGAPEVFTGPTTLFIYPEDLDDDGHFVTVLGATAPTDTTSSLAALGHTAGRFVGTATPLVLAGPDAISGDPFPFTLDVNYPRQAVQIRFLPGFAEALARFGLSAERQAVEDRILEVARRDFDGINITFAYADPLDFAEFSIIEVGGVDPNGSGLFGLDNTSGKDVGNRRFDDVIGGYNAETRAGNLAAYGGVFASELMNLSPTLSDNVLASPRFDDVFGDLAPELGGTPAERGESLGGPRTPFIRDAVRVLGNLVGSTITHEVGHALGLTALDGRYHNDGDTPNALMDAGVFRPFEERAELDGLGPATLEPFNRLYLESILPLD